MNESQSSKSYAGSYGFPSLPRLGINEWAFQLEQYLLGHCLTSRQRRTQHLLGTNWRRWPGFAEKKEDMHTAGNSNINSKFFVSAEPYFWSEYTNGIGGQYWVYHGAAATTGPWGGAVDIPSTGWITSKSTVNPVGWCFYCEQPPFSFCRKRWDTMNTFGPWPRALISPPHASFRQISYSLPPEKITQNARQSVWRAAVSFCWDCHQSWLGSFFGGSFFFDGLKVGGGELYLPTEVCICSCDPLA